MTFIPKKEYCPTCGDTHPKYIEGCPNKKVNTMNQNLTPITHEGITYLVDESANINVGDWVMGIENIPFQSLGAFKQVKDTGVYAIVCQPTTGTLEGVPYYKEEEETDARIEKLKALRDSHGIDYNANYYQERIDEALASKTKGEFTEEQMREAFREGQQWVKDISDDDKPYPRSFNDFIQSLRPKKRIIGATTDMETYFGEDGQKKFRRKPTNFTPKKKKRKKR